ncbi:MAG: hypothetical protein E7I16_03715 [Veillonella sp.]|nr:hypothetical protein [Veillonella sp.]
MIPIRGRQQVNIMSWINKYFHRLVKLNDPLMGTETFPTVAFVIVKELFNG